MHTKRLVFASHNNRSQSASLSIIIPPSKLRNTSAKKNGLMKFDNRSALNSQPPHQKLIRLYISIQLSSLLFSLKSERERERKRDIYKICQSTNGKRERERGFTQLMHQRGRNVSWLLGARANFCPPISFCLSCTPQGFKNPFEGIPLLRLPCRASFCTNAQARARTLCFCSTFALCCK